MLDVFADVPQPVVSLKKASLADIYDMYCVACLKGGLCGPNVLFPGIFIVTPDV